MAVIQISKIQLRRGQTAEQGMPQLSSGEMGWSVDEQRLFIGNGSVAEGAPAVGNTEILTESRMFEVLSSTRFTATNYTYAGHNTATTIVTGTGTNFPIVRTLQEKLDDNVTALDFGATDFANCTAAFQRALNQLYLNTDKSKDRSRVPLRIPAGTYFVTGTVYVPPYATIIGDGIDKTVIYSLNTGTIFATTASSTSTEYTEINISGMTLRHTGTTTTALSQPLMVLGNVSRSTIKDVKFKGNYTILTSSPTTSTYSAIDIRTWVTDLGNISIENCEVENLCYPIVSDYDVKDIVIKDNSFKDLYQGITLADNILGVSPLQYGPRRVTIKDNKFDRIERQAIFAGVNTTTNNAINSENNTFLDVGVGASTNTYDTSVITFESHGNSSINDNFQRLWEAQTNRVGYGQQQIIDGTAQVRLKFVDQKVLTTSTATQTLLRIPYNSANITSVDVAYTIAKTDVIRKGVVSIVGANSSNETSVRDSYATVGYDDGDVVFYADTTSTLGIGISDTLNVKYSNPNTTGTIIYTVSYYR